MKNTTKQPKQIHLTKENVYRLRQFHAMSLKEFAAKVGVSFVSIHRIETGELKISEKMSARIVEAFALTPNKLRSVTIHHKKNIEGYKNEEGGANE
ncbi:helix-turn-helix domain-containing protein [Planococcus halocryophilus]|uniref:helix-turn-helix domain-containing protein n=1 Tax=Planococcus halocryophilus TaxID=1215089 RepID=UPI001F0F1DB6|nr:helix-turn-helix transcriptional regulator [Planococcus halocryophilus]MCH4828174.1 helix-turn-helix transcriptional regulator [Planococcus halocryophilus]